MIFSFQQIARTFHKIQWFFHNLLKQIWISVTFQELWTPCSSITDPLCGKLVSETASPHKKYVIQGLGSCLVVSLNKWILFFFCMEETWEHVSVHWQQGNYLLWVNCFMCRKLVSETASPHKKHVIQELDSSLVVSLNKWRDNKEVGCSIPLHPTTWRVTWHCSSHSGMDQTQRGHELPH